MKAQFATLLIAGLAAGGAFAQTTAPLAGTADAPLKSNSPIQPAGAPEGRTPTAVNTPQPAAARVAPNAVIAPHSAQTAAPLAGTATAPTMSKSPIEPAGGAQGRAPTALTTPQPGAATVAPKGTASHGMNTHNQTMTKDAEKPSSPVVLTTPAPGPVNTTPNATPTGATPTAK